ncbi:MAG: hypothetical protein AB7G25_06540 [Sphingomonadaceae bacterium]
MAKGQVKSNKEARKPKKAKDKASGAGLPPRDPVQAAIKRDS